MFKDRMVGGASFVPVFAAEDGAGGAAAAGAEAVTPQPLIAPFDFRAHRVLMPGFSPGAPGAPPPVLPNARMPEPASAEPKGD